MAVCYVAPAMQSPLHTIDHRRRIMADHSIRPVNVDSVEIRLIRLPLKEAFETSFGRVHSRLIFLVSVVGHGLSGWGEVVAMEEPLYSYETIGTALHAIRDYLAPALLTRPVEGLDDLAARFATFKGHNMAKAGLAFAYQRIKLKIKPGWDVDVVAEARRRHPEILLSVDANSAYTLNDLERLKALDAFNLLMIEQPLDHDDLLDHATLQAELKTPICLDESITGLRRAEQALRLGSCRLINIKVGRVGGYSQALAIHDLCHARGVPVWCGGMLESGVGRAHNLALASLPGFTLPGDISASSRYF